MIQVPRLEPKDLFDRRARRDYARLRAYNTLLEQIYHRIYASSQLPGNNASILYTVPPFILGLPKLDMEDCIVYLVFQLRQSGFQVRFTWPNFLSISWAHHEGEYLMKQNPVIQAMLPDPVPTATSKRGVEAPAKQKKTKQAVSFMPQDVDLLTGASPSKQLEGSPFGASQYRTDLSVQQPLPQAPPRSASEYQPPASFLQNLDRPQKEKSASKGNVLADLWALQ